MDRRDEVMDELRHDLKELGPLISAARGIVAHSPTATIAVNAGGVGIWVAVTACVATLTGLLVGVIFVAIGLSDLNQQTQEIRLTNETQQAYINAAFAPKPEPEK